MGTFSGTNRKGMLCGHEMSATLTTCRKRAICAMFGKYLIADVVQSFENHHSHKTDILLILGPPVPIWASGGTTKLARSNFGSKSVPPPVDSLHIC